MTEEQRKKLIEDTIDMIADWESSCRLDFIEDLLSELSDESLDKVVEQQGVYAK